MKLFTKSDLERAARLSLLLRVREPEGDPELAIREAVATVANETQDYLSREQALEAAVLAANLAYRKASEPWGKDSFKSLGEKALRAVLDERGSGQRG